MTLSYINDKCYILTFFIIFVTDNLLHHLPNLQETRLSIAHFIYLRDSNLFKQGISILRKASECCILAKIVNCGQNSTVI